MAGVRYDIDRFKATLKELIEGYGDEFSSLPPFAHARSLGFGPGYTELDAMVLYMTVRDLRPKRYVEVGGGLSTYYCGLAGERNAADGAPVTIRCIEPSPVERLGTIPGVDVIRSEVQDVDVGLFLDLEADDVLAIDSSHIVRIDGDVPFLYLEVLPRLSQGVVVQVHDIPFPYNIPFPPERWVLGRTRDAPAWPVYWNEAMILQAFLAFNRDFEVTMSTPLIRHHDEDFLAGVIPFYKTVREEPNTFSSIWLRKVR